MTTTIVIANDQEEKMNAGNYVFKTTGALDVLMQYDTEGFDQTTNGSFTAASSGHIILPDCVLKVSNGAGHTIRLRPAPPYR